MFVGVAAFSRVRVPLIRSPAPAVSVALGSARGGAPLDGGVDASAPIGFRCARAPRLAWAPAPFAVLSLVERFDIEPFSGFSAK